MKLFRKIHFEIQVEQNSHSGNKKGFLNELEKKENTMKL